MSHNLEFGVDWYPEQWEESRWERDAGRMKEYGFSLVRMMEFAWAVVEPEPGRFDFSLFDRALDVLGRRGLKAVLGTPTATFPAWLLDGGEEVLMVAADGRRHDFGARRMGCYNAPAYREAALRVVRAATERFGQDRRVAGWQIDNEVGHEGSDRCYCAHCRKAWQAWLEARYGSVAAMNEVWGTVFWGTTYSRFDQVPQPRKQPGTGMNPGLLLDYDRFMSDSAVDWVQAQLEIVRAGARPEAFVTTNLYPPPLSNSIDMERLTRGMDFAGWDNYPVWGPMDEPYPPQFQALALAYTRGLRGSGPFAVMEQFAGFQGHVALGHNPPAAQAALWTVQAVARGADRVFFFRWRTAPYGQEQLCYGLHDSDDRETERGRALKATMARLRAELGTVAGEPYEADACLLYSKDDARVLREQYLSEGLRVPGHDWANPGYDLELARWFAPYAVLNVDADVKTPATVDLERYSIVSLPLYQMADPDFVARLDNWVRKGGVLVLGYRAGARDLRNWNVAEPLPGAFADLAGVRVSRFEALGTGSARIALRGPAGLLPARGEVWAEVLEPREAEVVATWADRRKCYRGEAAVSRNARGKGAVWYLGTSPDPAAMFLLYRRILKEAGLRPRFYGADAEVVTRRGPDGEMLRIAMNHSPRRKRVAGRVLPPWGWAVLA